MRISDWSSDVCSSDLLAAMAARLAALRDQQVDAGLDLANRMLLGADQGAHRDAMRPGPRDHRRRGDAKRVDDQPEIGRASCRERVFQSVSVLGGAVASK